MHKLEICGVSTDDRPPQRLLRPASGALLWEDPDDSLFTYESLI